MLLGLNVWFCRWLSRILSWKRGDKCSDTGSAFVQQALDKTEKKSLRKVSEPGLASQRWAAYSLLSDPRSLHYFLLCGTTSRQEREHLDQIWSLIYRRSGQDLLRWRRKLSSILSHPGGVSLLPNNHLENWGAGGMWDRCQGSFERKHLRSYCSVQILAQPVYVTLVQHVLLHLGLQGAQAEKTKCQLFHIFSVRIFLLMLTQDQVCLGLRNYQH